MASKISSSSASASASASASRSETLAAAPQITGDQDIYSSKDILSVIDSLKKQVVSDRFCYIKKKLEENKQKLNSITHKLYNLSKSQTNSAVGSTTAESDFLTRRQQEALCTLNSVEPSNGEDGNNFQEETLHASSTVLFGSHHGGKSAIKPVKLPEVQKLPPYTTWIFLDRNQRMTEDQSVLGRRRIYYDPSCGEALICSDSEDDLVEDEDEKREFGGVEDYIIRMTSQELGTSEAVMEALAQCLDRSSEEIRARYESFIKVPEQLIVRGEGEIHDRIADALLEKDLDAALDSFDNLFCRRCLVFDCRLHGCSQDLVFPAEKQLSWSNVDDVTPCGSRCFRLISNSLEENTQSSGSVEPLRSAKKKISGSVRRGKTHQSDSASSNAKVVSESSESEVHPRQGCNSSRTPPLKLKLHGKSGASKRSNKRVADRVLICMKKRQKKMMPSDTDSVGSGSICPRDMKLRSKSRKGNRDTTSSSQSKDVKSPNVKKSIKKGTSATDGEGHNESNGGTSKELCGSFDDESSRKEEHVDENISKYENPGNVSWKVIEKSLFVKGVEMFGRNSCLIARNLLNGMKSCMEVYLYMNMIETNGIAGSGDATDSLVEGQLKGNEMRTRSRFLRRRGRVRRLKYTWKSAGYHSIRKRITERKDQPCKQYNPCGCQTACGKQCTCLLNGTCCEKYCGCPKMCKNRFRGCHCAKSQCRSRQCPCFAADRECDPDVCRNCWVGCGDGSLGGPTQRGDNYECRNMKLLLKQQQRVLLGRSDVSGWGAFLKNSVGKHEYLGEYTGELISHREADKRGKIYDRENSSFLFNLNDQFVLDAFRKGDKLKFANHSPDPNCYAKVIMVAGDHRVGIFAKEKMSAGEELFYDYRYEPDRAPAWARKPQSSGAKKEETHHSSGRAKKLA